METLASAVGPYRKGQTTNSTDTSFPLLVPTTTKPAASATRSVFDLGHDGRRDTIAITVLPFGVPGANPSVRVTGWNRTQTGPSFLWVPETICEVQGTFSNRWGVALADVVATEAFVDPKTVIAGKAEILPGRFQAKIAGYEIYELTYQTGGAGDLNALIRLDTSVAFADAGAASGVSVSSLTTGDLALLSELEQLVSLGNADSKALKDLLTLQRLALKQRPPRRDIEAGQQYIGQVGGGYFRTAGVFPGGSMIGLDGVQRNIIPAAGDYAALDVVSDSTSAGNFLHFRGIVPRNGMGGIISRAVINFSAQGLLATCRLWLFHKKPTNTVTNDNVAFSLDDDDRGKVVGSLDFPALKDDGEVVTAQNITDRIVFKCEPDDDSLYGVLQFIIAEANEAASMTMQLELGGVL